MLNELCLSLSLMLGASTFPGADVTASRGGVTTSIHNIIGVNTGAAVTLSSRACYQSQMQLDAEKAYKRMPPDQKQNVLNHILEGEK